MMDLDFFILGGYGQFVWPAFIFSFVSCAFLFLKVKRELQKQEQKYLIKYGEFETENIETVEKTQISKKVLSGSSI